MRVKMRITIQMELKLTKTYKHLDPCTSTCMHVLNYNCMALEDNFIMW